MTEEFKALERALRSRRTELQELIVQMKTDDLNKSSVYRNLKHELKAIEKKLKNPADLLKK